MIRKLRNINKKEVFHHLLVWGLVAVSGFPFFYVTQEYILILLFIALYIYLKESIKFDTKSLSIFGAFFAVEMLQILIFKPFDFKLLAGTYIRLAVGFFIISLCRKDFIRYYVNVIYFFSIVSFIFFIPSALSPNIFKFFVRQVCPYFTPVFAHVINIYENRPTILIFTFDSAIPDFRNPGPFWEQGAFAIFLVIALLFNLMLENKMWTKKSIILSITLLSTLSTSGYIAYFVLLISYYLLHESFIKKLIFIGVTIPLAITLYFSLDFLSAKIENNIAVSSDDTSSRFGSALADLKEFSTSPLIGWGRGSMRYGGKKVKEYTAANHRNNGVTGLLATFGIFIFIFFFYNYYTGLRYATISNGLHPSYAFFSLVVILLLGFSQTIFQYSFFYSIMFIQFGYRLSEDGRKVLVFKG